MLVFAFNVFRGARNLDLKIAIKGKLRDEQEMEMKNNAHN